MNADQPFWLVGMTEMTRTFGLELLEAVLTAFPEIFHTVSTNIYSEVNRSNIVWVELHFMYIKQEF